LGNLADEIYAQKLQREYDEQEMERNRRLLNNLSLQQQNLDYGTVIRNTVEMARNSEMKNMCAKYGLTCSNVLFYVLDRFSPVGSLGRHREKQAQCQWSLYL
jgi:hypothetical protein